MSVSTSTTWVVGTINTGSSPSPYQYKNHNLTQCGASSNELMCGNNYYVNSLLYDSKLNYSVNDKQISTGECASFGGCPATGCGLDYSVCPNIGGIQAQVQWASQGNGSGGQNLKGTNSTVACLYPLATFNDLQTVLEFRDTFGSNPQNQKDPYNYQILPQFCSTQTTIGCPTDPATNQPMTACSQYVSSDKTNPCPDWLTSIAAADLVNGTNNADQALNEYCRFYNTADCLCINRFDSPVYQIMSVGQTADVDSCWWLPCEDTPDDPSTYLVTRSLPPCIEQNVQICENVDIAVGGDSSGLSFNPQNYTDCNLTDNNNGGNTNNNTNSFESFFSSWWFLLIAVIIIIIVILLLIFL